MMYRPDAALSPWPRRHGMKKTQPRAANTGPKAFAALTESIPGALP